MKLRSQYISFVYRGRMSLVLLLSLFAVSGHDVLAADGPQRQSIACSAHLPHDAVPVSNPRLCTIRRDGQTTLYACQDARAGSGLYRLYFKGGRQPKAIARINAKYEVMEFLWREKDVGIQPDCTLPAPPQLRVSTQFQGSGVCEEEDGHSVPCSVFRERVPRIKLYHVYMTFYEPGGRGPMNTRHIYTGVNKDAMPAELEYQIGLSLLKTRCCQQSGLKYIERALQLFPGSQLYRATYQRYQAELYEKQNHRLSFN